MLSLATLTSAPESSMTWLYLAQNKCQLTSCSTSYEKQVSRVKSHHASDSSILDQISQASLICAPLLPITAGAAVDGT